MSPRPRLLALFLLTAAACDGWAPSSPSDDVDPRPPAVERDTVAMGVARLSVRQVAALLKAIDDDKSCGFQSDAVKSAQDISGAPGDDGTVTWTVKDCVLNLVPEQKLDTDCAGNEVWAGGKATLSGTRVVHGVLTKDPKQPVAPDAADSATVTLHVIFDGFTVRDVKSNSQMTAKSGTLDVVAVPQLMPDSSTGVCTVPTPQIALHGLALTNAELSLKSHGNSLDTQVPASLLEVQVGQGAQHENWVQGQVTVWETKVAVPTPSDHDGLDPSYVRAEFIKSFSCDADLQLPLGAVCPPPREKPAQGASALSVKLFGVVARQIDADMQCGFAKAGLSGVPMGDLGTKSSMVFTLPAPCTLTFATPTVVDSDCTGHKTRLSGSVTVTGTKTLSGYLTGDPSEPVVPATSSPAAFDLTITANELLLSDDSPNTMVAHSGGLKGTLTPKTGLDSKTHACSIVTPIAHITLAHNDMSVEVNNGSIVVPLTLHTSALEAQTGTNGGHTNYLAGQVTAANQMLPIPSAGAQPVLDPSYDPAAFTASFMCNPNLTMPATESDCAFTRPLAEGAARLLVRDAAGAVQLINNNQFCGFQNTDLLQNPIEVIGDPGELGEMAWAANCNVGSGGLTGLSNDCFGVTTTMEGIAGMSAIRVVDGLRDQKCGGFLDLFCADTIHPIQPNDVLFQFNAGFANFAVGTADAKLVLHSGSMSATVRTMQGQNAFTGEFDVATPIASFDAVALSGADVSLITGAKTFRFSIAGAQLQAFSGSFGGGHNSLAGAITVDGVPVNLGNLPLQTPYDQTKFDQGYACTPGLVSTLPP
jgi:hypothetical protein